MAEPDEKEKAAKVTSMEVKRNTGEMAEKNRNGLRAWRELEPRAFGENLKQLSRFLQPKTRIMAVVKANAYGHGDKETARLLQEMYGIRDFAVATLEEGIRLRNAGIKGRILILGYTPPECLSRALTYELMQTLVDEDYAGEAIKHAPGLTVHLKVNTGMNRLGVNWDEQDKIRRILTDSRLKVQGIFSHLSMADENGAQEQLFTQQQIHRFTDLVAKLEQEGICPPDRHLQSSYGILKGPVSSCNLVRPGIFLYGVGSHWEDSPCLWEGEKDVSVLTSPRRTEEMEFRGQPALSVKARVGLIRQIAAGETASYGNGFHAKDSMKLAVLTIGYADGIPRNLKKAYVLLHGRRAPVVGRICMDQLEVDVSRIPEIRTGDTAVLLGRDGGEEIRAEEMASWAGTITNELLCRLGDRLPVIQI